MQGTGFWRWVRMWGLYAQLIQDMKDAFRSAPIIGIIHPIRERVHQGMIRTKSCINTPQNDWCFRKKLSTNFNDSFRSQIPIGHN